jgi:hypothetical protein
MRTTAPLLRFAAAEAALEDADGADDLTEFIAWAEDHAEEEQEHHLWFLDDLAAMSVDAEDVRGTVPHPRVLELLGVQFTLVATVHPVTVLGYFLAMECFPADPESVKALARRLDLPDDTLRTILFHTVADQEHKREILHMADRYGTDATRVAAMTTAAVAAVMGWTEYFSEFCDEFGRGANAA